MEIIHVGISYHGYKDTASVDITQSEDVHNAPNQTVFHKNHFSCWDCILRKVVCASCSILASWATEAASWATWLSWVTLDCTLFSPYMTLPSNSLTGTSKVLETSGTVTPRCSSISAKYCVCMCVCVCVGGILEFRMFVKQHLFGTLVHLVSFHQFTCLYIVKTGQWE